MDDNFLFNFKDGAFIQILICSQKIVLFLLNLKFESK